MFERGSVTAQRYAEGFDLEEYNYALKTIEEFAYGITMSWARAWLTRACLDLCGQKEYFCCAPKFLNSLIGRVPHARYERIMDYVYSFDCFHEFVPLSDKHYIEEVRQW